MKESLNNEREESLKAGNRREEKKMKRLEIAEKSPLFNYYVLGM